MASYQSGFDPPHRPEYASSRGKRLGTYIPAPSSDFQEPIGWGMVHREAGVAHISGQMDGNPPSQRSNARQTGIPVPRGQSPAYDVGPKTKTLSKFGFRRQASPSSNASAVEPLKSKHSRNVLRRKPSSIAQNGASKQQQPENSDDSLRNQDSWPIPQENRSRQAQSSFEATRSLDEREPTIPNLESPARIIPELDRYRFVGNQKGPVHNRFITDMPHKLATHDLPPPTPLNSGMSGHSRHSGYSGNSGFSAYSAYSASPSTRFSESPGPGAFSRDTTPTSISSQSPGVVAPLRMTPRLRQVSPINSRPPVSRRRAGSTPNTDEMEGGVLDAQGLPSLRESLTSSSSNSTVKGAEKAEKKKKKKRLSPLPPSPPPRKSSQKFKKLRSEEDEHPSPSKSSRTPAGSVMSPVQDSPVKSQSNVTSPSSSSKPAPPRRPSRDGTPDLTQLGESMTVIQSNLPGLHLSSDRRQSIGVLQKSPPQASVKKIDASPRPSNVSRLPSRGYSPSPGQKVNREATPAPSGLGIIPDLRPAINPPQYLIPGSRTPSPSTIAPKHRFGLFSRRAKTTPEVSTADQNEKPTRKGPSAGTGHEGYGRYALRSRSHSTPGNRDRSHSAASSQDSLASNSPHDPFLLERMSPVVIVGGGRVAENRSESLELSRSESSQNLSQTRPSTESKTSVSSNLSKEATRTTLWPSAMPQNYAANRSSTSLASKGTYLSESSDNDHSSAKPSLAFRRSMHRLLSSDQESLKLPQPIKISSSHSSPGSSQGTSLLSDDAQSIGAGKVKASAPRKLSKRPRSPRKWNFFQRTQTASPKPPPDAVPVVITEESASSRPVPYYAMMDSSEQEGDEAMDMVDILREAEVVDLSRISKDSPASQSQESMPKWQANLGVKSPSEMSLLTSISSPQRLFSSPEPLVAEVFPKPAETSSIDLPPARPSRLAQVGRIPRVVTARPEQTSPKSFSRPFARVSMIQPLPKLDTIDQHSIAIGPSPDRSPSPSRQPTQTLPESAFRGLGLDNSITGPSQAAVEESNQIQPSSAHDRAFLVVSPRKNSEATTSSSSGAVSTTAIVPEPDAALEEDEVWDEYDDLIGNEESLKVPVSATSSHGVPFQYEGFESRAMKRANEQKKESPIVTASGSFVKENGSRKLPRLELTSSSMYSPDLSAGFKRVFNSIPSPSTPMSFTEFFSGYGERNNSVITGSGGTKRMSSPYSQRDSRPTSSHSKSASMSEISRKSVDSRLVTISELSQESPIAQVNLRVGSLTVSKWLTFGHVLFSPAREEIIHPPDQNKPHSVLIVDGLGNDDFSYYACETHPTATFYNLSPTSAINGVPSQSAMSSFPQPPKNHRQVQYTNNLEKFPFPRDTFTAVVLRFPSACSETSFRNLITESRRVLKPSGYLEMSILDLDMMNMGNRTRRAVRGLKVNISVADPSMSLASASDTALRMIGKRAFHDVKSCKVGVPVASTVTATSGTGSHSGSEGKSDDNDISLADMMKDETSVGDDGIAKMVAKVGRFWFLRCYERSILPNGDPSRSIFADAAVLQECEKWNTSFKLLVAYAQKPAVPRRRTASV